MGMIATHGRQSEEGCFILRRRAATRSTVDANPILTCLFLLLMLLLLVLLLLLLLAAAGSEVNHFKFCSVLVIHTQGPRILVHITTKTQKDLPGHHKPVGESIST